MSKTVDKFGSVQESDAVQLIDILPILRVVDSVPLLLDREMTPIAAADRLTSKVPACLRHYHSGPLA